MEQKPALLPPSRREHGPGIDGRDYDEGLFAFALSLAGNRDDASELTQETFCRLAGWRASYFWRNVAARL